MKNIPVCLCSDWCYRTQVSCDGHCKGKSNISTSQRWMSHIHPSSQHHISMFPQGPERWSEVKADCGKGRQSPINIVTKKTKLDERLTPFKFTRYQDAFDSTVTNNGHSGKSTDRRPAEVEDEE